MVLRNGFGSLEDLTQLSQLDSGNGKFTSFLVSYLNVFDNRFLLQ